MVCMMRLNAFKFVQKSMGGPEISQCFIQRWKGRGGKSAVLDRWWRTQRSHGFHLQVSWFCIEMWDLLDEVLVKVYQIPVAYQVFFLMKRSKNTKSPRISGPFFFHPPAAKVL